MKSVEIVTHVFCCPGVDQYAEMLRWQFASLWAHSVSDVQATLTVHHTPHDAATTGALKALFAEWGQSPFRDFGSRLRLEAVAWEPKYLFRRAIGRNYSAIHSTADVVWFTDVDYLFGPGVLLAVADQVAPDRSLCVPERYRINVDHATGDAMIQSSRGMSWANLLSRLHRLPEAEQDCFAERSQKTAIGGLQIIGGDVARKIGYLKGTKHVEPVDPVFGFRSCKCDKLWRRENKLSAERIPVPQVYRLRHSVDGRDYDGAGIKGDGKENW